jgi:Glycosyl hydrolase catalytic core
MDAEGWSPVIVQAALLATLLGLPVAPGALADAASGPQLGDPGVGIHANPDAPDVPPVGVFGTERLWDTGAIWCRMNPQPGVWDFTPLTSQLDAAAARGAVSAIVVLGFPPGHVSDGVPNPGQANWLCPEQGLATQAPSDEVWQDYLHRTAEVVAAWRTTHPLLTVHFQVWNEPALAWFLRRDQRPQRLVELAAQARSIVQATVPGALILSPPMMPRTTAHRMRWQEEFVTAASTWVDTHGGFLFDVWTVHVYPVGADFAQVWSGPQGYLVRIDDVMSLIGPGRRSGDQVWITEINANIAFKAPATQVLSDADQVAFVQAVGQDAALRGIPVVVWYRWHYDPWGLGNGQIVLSGSSAAMGAWR